ncbi:MAG: DJ-1/PfpI family protein [Burkholderiales bacterium]
MKIAFLVYDGMTLLDFAGFYDPVTRLKTMGFVPDLEYAVCARKNIIKSFEGAVLTPDVAGGGLNAYDYIFIPGGRGIQALLGDATFLEWIRSVSPAAVKTAVCGGVLALGAAGLLNGRKATTHPNHMQQLKRFAKEVSAERVVEDGDIITAGGVTSAIDLGLYVCERIAGKEARERIQAQMDYRAYPY